MNQLIKSFGTVYELCEFLNAYSNFNQNQLKLPEMHKKLSTLVKIMDNT